MSQIEIKATIDANDPNQVAAACAFLQSINSGKQATPKKETPKVEKPKAEAPKKETPKATPKKETPKVEKPKAEAPKKETAKTGIKIEEVRALLAKKVNDHRGEIKSKLTELGANNVTSLAKESYQDFMDFLNGLG